LVKIQFCSIETLYGRNTHTENTLHKSIKQKIII
jgi:hypothetical protein